MKCSHHQGFIMTLYEQEKVRLRGNKRSDGASRDCEGHHAGTPQQMFSFVPFTVHTMEVEYTPGLAHTN
ncbi:hypothetical protein Pmani_020616 [Petrolisthes manimaculis]|uniref:Uncharacterized protein n=1 Tax=Petrolisthes manimaculis TaxID=1843537 RepID=A0AAE1U2E0_9EUCA|nr:hypothetical protein Pmani_020616 [Petrolisthes manimaculis]